MEGADGVLTLNGKFDDLISDNSDDGSPGQNRQSSGSGFEFFKALIGRGFQEGPEPLVCHVKITLVCDLKGGMHG